MVRYLQLKELHDLGWGFHLHLLTLLKGVFFFFLDEEDEAKQITFHVVNHSEVKGRKNYKL